MSSKENNKVTVTEHLDRLANSALRTTAPDTTRKLQGLSSYTFLVWYVAASSVSLAALFWYFYTQNCSFRSEIIPNLYDYSFYNSYGSGRNYLCNTRIAMTRPVMESWYTAAPEPKSNNGLSVTPIERITFYCLLGNFKASDYGKFRYFSV
jgi:hypothetical protein